MHINLTINATSDVLSFSATGHANEMKFSGVLVNLDTPSTKPPNGSQGKRIMIPSSTAKAAVHTLVNMGVNYTDKLDGHNPQKKVGVIKKAWIDGHDIRVSGIIWKRDFPDAKKHLKRKDLGMSFEATDIGVEDQNAAVWKIVSMCFTGASILKKSDAAYHTTEALAASKFKKAASQITITQGGISMAHKSKEKVPAKKTSKKVAVEASGENIGEVLTGLTVVVKDMSKSFRAMTASNNAIRSEMHLLAAGVQAAESESEESESIAATADESESAESESIEAGGFPFKKKKGEDKSASESSESSESMSAEADDDGDLADMESDEPGEDEDKPGHLNDKAKQKGRKTTSEDKVGKEVNEPILGSQMKRLLKTVKGLEAARVADQKQIKKLTKRLRENQVQLKAAADKTDRRTVSPLGRTLLSKGGTDPEAIQASGEKLSVEEVDSMLASSPQPLDSTTRMAIKTEFARKGIMVEGQVAATQVN